MHIQTKMIHGGISEDQLLEQSVFPSIKPRLTVKTVWANPNTMSILVQVIQLGLL